MRASSPSTPSMTETAYLRGSTGDFLDLGWSLAMSGDMIVAGAPSYDVGIKDDAGAILITRDVTADQLAGQMRDELVASVVTPHPASVWAQGLPREVLAGPPKGYTDLVLDDEFPLSMFFEALEKKMRGVIESTAGIRGTDA